VTQLKTKYTWHIIHLFCDMHHTEFTKSEQFWRHIPSSWRQREKWGNHNRSVAWMNCTLAWTIRPTAWMIWCQSKKSWWHN